MGKRRTFGSIMQRTKADGTKDPHYTVRYRDPKGRERWASGFPTRKDAERYLAETHASVLRFERFGEAEIRKVTLAEFRKEFEATRHTKAPGTRASDAGRYDVLVKEFGNATLDSITPADIEGFRNRLATQRRCKCSGADLKDCTHGTMAVGTQNRYLALCSAIFRTAIASGCADRNPCRGIERQTEDKPDVVVLSAVELDRVALHVPMELRPAFILACETGCRRSELQRADWNDIDWKAGPLGSLLIRRGKSKRAKRAIALTAKARAVVDGLKDELGAIPARGGPLLPMLSERWGWDRLSKWAPRASVAAGLPRMRLHDCRHLFAVRLLRSGTPLSDVAALLGDTVAVVSERYARHVPTDSGMLAVARLQAAESGAAAEATSKTGT